MITDALLRFVAWVVDTVGSWMPTYTTPAWLSDLSSNLQPVLDTAASLGNWLPMSLGLQVTAAVLLAIVVGLGIKVVRSVASYFLAGGGSSG